MTSVITSARTSTASLFDMVGVTANTITQVISTASRAVDALDRKTDLMHHRVKISTMANKVLVEDDEITKAATEHTDLMEEVYKRNYPDKNFDREKFFEAALEKIKAATAA